MSHCQLSNGQTFREMVAVNVVDPSVMEYSRRTFRRVASIFLRGGTVGHDDGGTEGPQRGAEAPSAGAPRGWGWGGAP